MVIEGDRLHGPLLRVLKITVHAVLLRVTPQPVHEVRVLVLLIPVDLAVWDLVYAIMCLFLAFVIDLAFIHIVKVFLSIRVLAFIFNYLIMDLLLFERRMRLVVRSCRSLYELILEVRPLFVFWRRAFGRVVPAAARLSSGLGLLVGVGVLYGQVSGDHIGPHLVLVHFDVYVVDGGSACL